MKKPRHAQHHLFWKISIFPLLLAAVPAVCPAQEFPSKSLRIVVGYPPGGVNDILARVVAQKLSEAWGQQAIVDNRPGASGVIGIEMVARAAADGHTLGVASLSPLVFSRFAYAKLPYDSITDLAPLTTLAMTPMLIAVHPSVPARSVKELIALTRAQPGKLDFAISGTGGMTHLVIELLRSTAGVQLQTVPYKGATPALNDTLAGQVQGMVEAFPALSPLVKQGRLRGIAVTSEKRNPLLPQVPSSAEQGLHYLVVANWFGFVAPARTPRPIIEKLHATLIKIPAQPDVKERFDALGLEPMTMASPEAFGGFLKSEIARWGKVAQSAGIKAQ